MKMKTELYTLIQQHINQQNQSYEQTLTLLIKQMGYTDRQQHKAQQRLQAVLSSPELGLVDVSKTGYDFKYTASEFVHALCEALKIEQADYLPLLSEFKIYANNVHHTKMPYVIADIEWSDDFQPSFMSMMAVGQFKKVRLADDIRLLEPSEQLKNIKQAIHHHYNKMKSPLPFDGVVQGYWIHLYPDGNQQTQYMEVV